MSLPNLGKYGTAKYVLVEDEYMYLANIFLEYEQEMNICFFSGKVVSDIEFKFIINSKDVSICYFNLQLQNNTIIKIIAYNEIADYCYRNLRKGDLAYMWGYLNYEYSIIINYIKVF